MKTYTEYLNEACDHYRAGDGTVMMNLARAEAQEKFNNDLAQQVSDLQEVVKMLEERTTLCACDGIPHTKRDCKICKTND